MEYLRNTKDACMDRDDMLRRSPPGLPIGPESWTMDDWYYYLRRFANEREKKQARAFINDRLGRIVEERKTNGNNNLNNRNPA